MSGYEPKEEQYRIW